MTNSVLRLLSGENTSLGIQGTGLLARFSIRAGYIMGRLRVISELDRK